MCKHETLEYVGEQKTDDGVNMYYKCKACGDMLVVTPERKVIAIKGIQPDEPSSTRGKPA
ncbi:MAG: hypothetical protein OK438_02610 [Thaumarchaeota archaeon]|nr:hypothetical protein [Nitrososphaerota archaeon]